MRATIAGQYETTQHLVARANRGIAFMGEIDNIIHLFIYIHIAHTVFNPPDVPYECV